MWEKSIPVRFNHEKCTRQVIPNQSEGVFTHPSMSINIRKSVYISLYVWEINQIIFQVYDFFFFLNPITKNKAFFFSHYISV